VGPAAAMIPKGSKVFIIPDGILNQLNFETLLAPGAEGRHYWIEDVTVTNANSIRLLSRFDTGSSAADEIKLLMIGNPISTGTGYESLLNAFAEIRGIEKHIPPDRRTVVTQAEACLLYTSRSRGLFLLRRRCRYLLSVGLQRRGQKRSISGKWFPAVRHTPAFLAVRSPRMALGR